MSSHKRSCDAEPLDRPSRPRTEANPNTHDVDGIESYIAALPSEESVLASMAAVTSAQNDLRSALRDVLDPSRPLDALQAIDAAEKAERLNVIVERMTWMFSAAQRATHAHTTRLNEYLRSRREKGNPTSPSTSKTACWSALPKVLKESVMQLVVDPMDIVHLAQTHRDGFEAALTVKVDQRCLNPIQVAAHPLPNIPPASHWNISRRMPLAIHILPSPATFYGFKDSHADALIISLAGLHITHVRVSCLIDLGPAVRLFSYPALQGLVEIIVDYKTQEFARHKLSEAPLARAAAKRFLREVYPPVEANTFGLDHENIWVQYHHRVHPDIIRAPMYDTSTVALRSRSYAARRTPTGDTDWFVREDDGNWTLTPLFPVIADMKNRVDSFENRAMYLLWWKKKHAMTWRV